MATSNHPDSTAQVSTPAHLPTPAAPPPSLLGQPYQAGVAVRLRPLDSSPGLRSYAPGPNNEYIHSPIPDDTFPEPPPLKVISRPVCIDFRRGVHETMLYPQRFDPLRPYLPFVERFELHRDLFIRDIVAYVYARDDWTALPDNPTLGTTDPALIESLKATYIPVREDCTKQLASVDARYHPTALIESANHQLDLLEHHAMPYEPAGDAVTDIQRAIAELRAFYVWARVVPHDADESKWTFAPSTFNYVGAFVSEGIDCHRLYSCGAPVWLLTTGQPRPSVPLIEQKDPVRSPALFLELRSRVDMVRVPTPPLSARFGRGERWQHHRAEPTPSSRSRSRSPRRNTPATGSSRPRSPAPKSTQVDFAQMRWRLHEQFPYTYKYADEADNAAQGMLPAPPLYTLTANLTRAASSRRPPEAPTAWFSRHWDPDPTGLLEQLKEDSGNKFPRLAPFIAAAAERVNFSARREWMLCATRFDPVPQQDIRTAGKQGLRLFFPPISILMKNTARVTWAWSNWAALMDFWEHRLEHELEPVELGVLNKAWRAWLDGKYIKDRTLYLPEQTGIDPSPSLTAYVAAQLKTKAFQDLVVAAELATLARLQEEAQIKQAAREAEEKLLQKEVEQREQEYQEQLRGNQSEQDDEDGEQSCNILAAPATAALTTPPTAPAPMTAHASPLPLPPPAPVQPAVATEVATAAALPLVPDDDDAAQTAYEAHLLEQASRYPNLSVHEYEVRRDRGDFNDSDDDSFDDDPTGLPCGVPHPDNEVTWGAFTWSRDDEDRPKDLTFYHESTRGKMKVGWDERYAANTIVAFEQDKRDDSLLIKVSRRARILELRANRVEY